MKLKVNPNVTFTKDERKGLIFVITMISIALIAIVLINNFDKPEKITLEELHPEILHKVDSTLVKNKFEKPKGQNSSNELKKQVHNFSFDPNIISKDSLKLLNIDDKTISILLKYRAKGKIYSKEQFYKIYGMEKYKSRIDSLIVFSENKKSNSYQKKQQDTVYSSGQGHINKNQSFENYKKKDSLSRNSYNSNNHYNKKHNTDESGISIVTIKYIKLNETDSFELETVKGLGIKLSSRIIKYRDKLGGFYEVEQLEEVFGLRQETFLNINHLMIIDKSKIKKIKINHADFQTLSSHPYIGKHKAGVLLRYKENHGDYKDIEDVRKTVIIQEKTLEKLIHYLDFSPSK